MSSTFPGLLGVPPPLPPAVPPGPAAAAVVRLIRAARMCPPCDPTRGQSCSECDGTAAEERGIWLEQFYADRDAARGAR